MAALVGAARRLVTNACGAFDPQAELVRELAEASALSEGSVRWALEHALEWRATEADCAAVVKNAGPDVSGSLAVVLSANVTTAALRALACAVARSNHVRVYPSSRDPVLTERLVAAAGLPGLTVVRTREELPWADPSAHVVLYGSDGTAARVRELVRGTLEVHGPGIGLALLTDEDDVASMGALAEDLAAFDQAGCLSPRLCIHIGDPARGHFLSKSLHTALEALGAARPIGALDPETRAARARFRQVGTVLGQTFATTQGVVVHATSGSPLPAPEARALAVRTLSSLADADDWLGPLRPLITAVGARDHALRSQFAPEARLRRTDVGSMQRPPLDGPVDRRAVHSSHRIRGNVRLDG